jgi:hypothetical protein
MLAVRSFWSQAMHTPNNATPDTPYYTRLDILYQPLEIIDVGAMSITMSSFCGERSVHHRS